MNIAYKVLRTILTPIYKFYYNPGNGDIYNNWRYAFY